MKNLPGFSDEFYYPGQGSDIDTVQEAQEHRPLSSSYA
jgi:hypothetical protein